MSGRDDPEANLWRRIRVWTDAMPWLALARCLRPATSPALVALAVAGFWLAAAGTMLVTGRWPDAATPVAWEAAGPRAAEGDAEGAAEGVFLPERLRRAWQTAPGMPDAARSIAAPAVLLGDPPATAARMANRLAVQLWLLAVWAVPAGLIVRQGMLAVAGRQPMGLIDGLVLAARRAPALLLAALLPPAAASAAGCFFLLPGWLGRIPSVGAWLAEPTALLAVPLAVAAGLLAFGALLAVPLAWAAVMAEPQGDAFDALSRGFEYVLRRPLHLAFYLLLAWLISRIAGALAMGITQVGEGIAGRFWAWAADGDATLTVAPSVLRSVPEAFAIVLFWTLVGGIYLLLRRDANSQEVEDVWEPPPAPRHGLAPQRR